MKLSEIPPHRFKCHEWMQYIVRWTNQGQPVFDCAFRRQDIVSMIQRYRNEFGPITTKDEILHMLEIHTHLYPNSTPQEHHIRAVATILKGGLK